MRKDTIKIAFGSVPKGCGTFTFYRNLRLALKAYGIDLQCVTVGKREAGLVEDAYVDCGCVLLSPNSSYVKEQSQTFTKWCQQEAFDIVMAINSEAILSALPHLPKHIRVLSRCANGFDEGYRVTLSGKERLMGIMTLTPRLTNDLVNKYGVSSDTIHLCPNGIDPTPFATITDCKRHGPEGSPIQLGFMGRLEHKQKGVLHLPKIVQELKHLGVPFHLRIAGKGIHRPKLEKQLQPYIQSGEVELIGTITRQEVPKFLKSADVFLFTSHFEGISNALLESIMAGCVPVTFLIKDLTDFVLDHGRTGFIAPMEDCSAFAGYVAQLANDRTLLQQMSESTLAAAHERFAVPIAAARHAELFGKVMEMPLPDFEPLPWSQFEIDPVYRKRWTGYLPEFMKKRAKSLLANRS